MQDIIEYVKSYIEECEQRSKNWEEKINKITEYIKSAETDEDIQRLKWERQRCIGKQNELLAVSDFGNELLNRLKLNEKGGMTYQ